MTPTTLDRLRFDNRFTAALVPDPDRSNRRRHVSGAHFSRVEPTPVSSPKVLAWSPEVAALLGLDRAMLDDEDLAQVLSGNRLPLGSDPFAMNYGGHQFGNWAGQLGDGRAIAIGEVIDVHGGHQTLQLKGPGPTPYSRTADGRAVLRSSIREFLCSEAMHHLGVPTTRALSLVTTGDQVMRDMLYDGNPALEPGAIVCRVAPSFVRFGNFQLPASRGELDSLRQLIRFTIDADFPEFAPLIADSDTWDIGVTDWFGEVCARTVNLVVDWMRVGFVHGVLNTDNMSILGLTIDYGPYGWLEDFDPGWTPNTTDAGGRRYRYGHQPQVVYWNLVQLANALATVVSDVSLLQAQIDRFPERYGTRFRTMMGTRLGFAAATPDDDQLIDQLLLVLTRAEIDQVIWFRSLARIVEQYGAGEEQVADHLTDHLTDGLTDDELLDPLSDAWYSPASITGDVSHDLASWLRTWIARVRRDGRDPMTVCAQMNSVNPKYVLRNYLAQEAIDLATAGDPSLVTELLDVLRRPYDDQPGRERFAQKRPEWARTRVGCSMLSCSS